MLQQMTAPLQGQKRNAMYSDVGQAGAHLPPAPNRALEIPAAVSTLNERVEAMQKEVTILEQRLCSILQPRTPDRVSPEIPSYAGGTQVGADIARATNGIEGCIFTIRQMLDLLEL